MSINVDRNRYSLVQSQKRHVQERRYFGRNQPPQFWNAMYDRRDQVLGSILILGLTGSGKSQLLCFILLDRWENLKVPRLNIEHVKIVMLDASSKSELACAFAPMTSNHPLWRILEKQGRSPRGYPVEIYRPLTMGAETPMMPDIQPTLQPSIVKPFTLAIDSLTINEWNHILSLGENQSQKNLHKAVWMHELKAGRLPSDTLFDFIPVAEKLATSGDVGISPNIAGIESLPPIVTSKRFSRREEGSLLQKYEKLASTGLIMPKEFGGNRFPSLDMRKILEDWGTITVFNIPPYSEAPELHAAVFTVILSRVRDEKRLGRPERVKMPVTIGMPELGLFAKRSPDPTERDWMLPLRNTVEGIVKQAQGTGVSIIGDVQNVVGDSVPSYTPVLVRRSDDQIDVLAVEELFSEIALSKHERLVGRNGEEILKPSSLYWTWTDDKGRAKWTRLRHVLRHHYKGPTFIVVSSGGIVETTPSHSIYTWALGSRRSSRSFLRTPQSILPGELLVIPSKMPKIREKDRFFFGDEELAWLYGFFAAEGSAYRSKQMLRYHTSISNNDRKLLERAKRAMMRFFGNGEPFIAEQQRYTNIATTYNYFWNGRHLYEWFRTRFYTPGGLKRVPKEILNAPSNIRRAFLDGYWAGDGSKDGSRCDTNSMPLAAGLRYLWTISGQKTAVSVLQERPNITRIYPVKGKNGVRATRKVKRVVRRTYDGYVYDLETVNHHFLAGVGPVLVHNSGIHTEIMKNMPGLCIFNMGQDDIKELLRDRSLRNRRAFDNYQLSQLPEQGNFILIRPYSNWAELYGRGSSPIVRFFYPRAAVGRSNVETDYLGLYRLLYPFRSNPEKYADVTPIYDLARQCIQFSHQRAKKVADELIKEREEKGEDEDADDGGERKEKKKPWSAEDRNRLKVVFESFKDMGDTANVDTGKLVDAMHENRYKVFRFIERMHEYHLCMVDRKQKTHLVVILDINEIRKFLASGAASTA